MKTVICSDVHLDASDRAGHAAFIQFLRSLDPAEVERLIILGDLFDFWFEYRHVIFSGYFNVLRALADLTDAGLALHLVCGNHDFWAGRFLRDSLRVAIHPAPVTLPFGARRVLLVHGDGLNPGDWSYRAYKRVARARPVIWLFSLLHPDWAMRIARGVSYGSRAITHVEDRANGAEVVSQRAFAHKLLAEAEVDTVICGHTHHPLLEEHAGPAGTGLYINTGDWIQHQTYVVWDGERFDLRHFVAA
jgi:UDP-2,3-diacylglucosamine hydrolase